ncbi:hypothetical protein J6590_040690 [Homalodisca vitripennis]|nr:hypothetical protein J6590_040690 [Homalodisca vitripennis]
MDKSLRINCNSQRLRVGAKWAEQMSNETAMYGQDEDLNPVISQFQLVHFNLCVLYLRELSPGVLLPVDVLPNLWDEMLVCDKLLMFPAYWNIRLLKAFGILPANFRARGSCQSVGSPGFSELLISADLRDLDQY